MAASISSKVKSYKYGFGPFAPEAYKMQYPYYFREKNGVNETAYDQNILQQMETFFHCVVAAEEVAAIVMEPVQGLAGTIIPSRRFVQGVKRICEKYGILFIADEVQTGFCRTGKMFAIENFDVVPDILFTAKSMAAGLPLAAVTGRADIMDAPKPGEMGTTFGGSPLACVAALRSIEIMEQEKLAERANGIGEKIISRFRRLQQKYPVVGDVRGLGAMCAMELVKDLETKAPDKELTERITHECNKRGLVMINAGLYGNVIRILSPLVITDEQLEEGLDVIEEVFADLLN